MARRIRVVAIQGVASLNQYARMHDGFDEYGLLCGGTRAVKSGFFRLRVNACACQQRHRRKGRRRRECSDMSCTPEDKKAVLAVLAAAGVKHKTRFVWEKRG